MQVWYLGDMLDPRMNVGTGSIVYSGQVVFTAEIKGVLKLALVFTEKFRTLSTI